MISIVITATGAIASLHTKSQSRMLFTLPLDSEDGGMFRLAQRCRDALKKQRVSGRKIHIVLLENVIYKEFTHSPASAKTVAGFAGLEARTILREQAGNYLVSQFSFGRFKNANGEESSLLLASPATMLKALQAAFSSNGFRIESVHSGFDAFKAACEKAVVPKFGQKSFVAIDFSLEHTLVNVYSGGNLASQRRLPGFSSAILRLLPDEFGKTDSEKIQKLRSETFETILSESVESAVVSFLWDTLRTVRVVTAPLQLDIEEFFICGDVCNSDTLCKLLKNTLELPCVFASSSDLSAAWCKYTTPHLLLAGGACFSNVDLTAPIRVAKKTVILDVFFCVAISIIVCIGFVAQPFAISLKQTELRSLETRYESFTSLRNIFDEISKYSNLVNGLELRKEGLNAYKSNLGETHPQVENLFNSEGLTITSLSYDGSKGTYSVLFDAATKEIFLRLKDKIYANKAYFLNLNLSSNENKESGTYQCTLSFIPSSYKALPEPKEATTTVEEPVTPDIVEDFTNEAN